jgi:hypothetical protein
MRGQGLVDAGGGVGDEEFEGALVVADLAAEFKETVVGQGVSNGKAADLCPVDGKVCLVLLVEDVQLQKEKVRKRE